MFPRVMRRAVTIRSKEERIPMFVARSVIKRGLNRFIPAEAFGKRGSSRGSGGEGWWVSSWKEEGDG